MKKKLGSALLIAALLIALLPMALLWANAETLSGSCGEHASWTFNRSTGALVISGTGEIAGSTAPHTTSREDLPVISYEWESYRKQIVTVTVGSGITGVGKEAFCACTKLRSVVLPATVSVLRTGAFSGCTGLKQIVIPNRSCIFYADASSFASKTATTIYGFRSSTAQTFANRYGFRFSALPTDYGTQNPFVDVPSSAFYHDAVLWAVKQNPKITNGTDEISFSPNQSCTRAQVVTFLWRAYKQPSASGTNPFVDVKSSDYYAKAVQWAVKKNITAGTDATHFSPNNPCTRAQVVTFLWRAAGKPQPKTTANPFKDVANDYYKTAVLWAVEQGITNGTDATHFSPNRICTRGEIATFLWRALK